MEESIIQVLASQTISKERSPEPGSSYLHVINFDTGTAVYAYKKHWQFGYILGNWGESYQISVGFVEDDWEDADVNRQNVLLASKVRTTAAVLDQLELLQPPIFSGTVTAFREDVYTAILDTFHGLKKNQTGYIIQYLKAGHADDQILLDKLSLLEIDQYLSLNAGNETEMKTLLGTALLENPFNTRYARLINYFENVYKEEFIDIGTLHIKLTEKLLKTGDFGKFTNWKDFFDDYLSNFAIEKYNNRSPLFGPINLGQFSSYYETYVKDISSDDRFGYLYHIEATAENLLETDVYIPEYSAVRSCQFYLGEDFFVEGDTVDFITGFGGFQSTAVRFNNRNGELANLETFPDYDDRFISVPNAYLQKANNFFTRTMKYHHPYKLYTTVLLDGKDKGMIVALRTYYMSTRDLSQEAKEIGEDYPDFILYMPEWGRERLDYDDLDRLEHYDTAFYTIGDIVSVTGIQLSEGVVVDTLLKNDYRWYAVYSAPEGRASSVMYYPELLLRKYGSQDLTRTYHLSTFKFKDVDFEEEVEIIENQPDLTQIAKLDEIFPGTTVILPTDEDPIISEESVALIEPVVHESKEVAIYRKPVLFKNRIDEQIKYAAASVGIILVYSLL